MMDKTQSSKTKIAGKIIGMALIIGGSLFLAIFLWQIGALENFEGVTWNLRQALFAASKKPHPDIAVILLDQKSLDWASDENGLSWPWPREAYAIVAGFCKRAEARALAFDVVYTEPSKYGVEDDELFAAKVRDFGKTVCTVALSDSAGSTKKWPDYSTGLSVEIENVNEWIKSHPEAKLDFKEATFPTEDLAPSFAYLSNVVQSADPDGIYRSLNYFTIFDYRIVPSMALAMYLAGEEKKPAITLSDSSIKIGDKSLPVTKKGKGLLRFRGASGTHKNYNAAEIIRSEKQIEEGSAPDVNPSELAGKYVFFGFSAPGLLDLRPTPLDASYPGVEIHATMLNSILSGDLIAEIPFVFAIIAIIAVVLLTAIFALFASSTVRTIIAYSVGMALPFALGIGAFNFGYQFPIVVTELACLLTLVSGGILNYATEGRQKRFIKGAFSQYLSPTVIEQLLANPDRLSLGGERRELSMFFSDIQGFTSISERLNPEELTSVLNEYLSAMTDIIMEEGGTVDKYEGDAIIAFWNAPLDLPDHAERAVRASLRCQKKLSEMRQYLKERTGTDLYMRIGLNTGYAVVGNMGSKNRFDYTMLGDSVNLAARLEGINKQFHTYTMVSKATKEAALKTAGAGFGFRELSRVAVVGKKEPIVVFEPMFIDEYEQKKETIETFEAGLYAYYEKDFEKAIGLLKKIEGYDPPASPYIARCEELRKNPPSEWNGVWVMTSK